MEEVKLEEVDPLMIEEQFLDDELDLLHDEPDVDVMSDGPDLLDDEFHCCEVCRMLLIGFNRYLPNDQSDIVKRGRPTPVMKNLIYNNGKGQVRYFNGNKYYQTEWLTGCEQRARLFCWPCLIFSTKSDPWTTTGVSDLNNLLYMVKRHSTLQHHIEAVVKLKTYGKEIPQISSDAEEETFEEEMTTMRLKEEVLKNREILHKLVTVCCFIGGKEMCFSEAEESDVSDPIKQSKYEQFLQFIGKYDEFLERQLIDNKQFLNEKLRSIIFSAISKTVTNKIVKEISESRFVSLIMDEVAEMDNSTLVSTVVRYTTSQGEVKEKFLNFREIPMGSRVDSLFRVICENFQMLDCFNKCVSFSLDGGMVHITELFIIQAQIREVCPNAFLLHCCQHQLVSVLAQALSTIKECKHFFFTLNGLAAMFFKSKALSDRLNLLIQRTIPSAQDFKWHFNGSLINNVCGIRAVLIELFEAIVNYKEDWDFEISLASSRFLEVLTKDLTFNFLLMILGDIFLRTDELSSVINKFHLVTSCVNSVKEYINFIRKKKDSFQILYSNATSLVNSSNPSNKIKLEHPTTDAHLTTCQKLFNSIIGNIVTQMNCRFGELSRLSFVPFTNCKSTIKMNSSLLDPITNNFHCSFDVTAFLTEMSVLTEWQAFQKSNQRDTLRYIRLMDLASILPQTVTLLELYLTLPLTEVSSTLDRIQMYVFSSTPRQRLSPLPILNIEGDFVDELMKDSKFYNDVIEEIKQNDPPILLEIDVSSH